jgi:hypothetical protein
LYVLVLHLPHELEHHQAEEKKDGTQPKRSSPKHGYESG